MVKSSIIIIISCITLMGFISSYNFGTTDFNFGEPTTTTTTTPGVTGDCPDGQFVQNITTGGIQCTTPAGGGDIEGVTAGTNLSGGGTSGTVTLNLNGTSVLTWLE